MNVHSVSARGKCCENVCKKESRVRTGTLGIKSGERATTSTTLCSFHSAASHCATQSSEDLGPEGQELEPPHIKEEVEDEEVHRIKDEEKLEPTPIKKEDEEEHTHIKHEVEEDITKFPLTGVPLKGEDEGQSEGSRGAEAPSNSSSQHMTTEADGDHCGGSQANGLLAPLSDSDDMTSHPPHTDDDDGQSEGDLTCHTENKRRKCSQCGKIFAFLSNLKRHMEIHTGEKVFACSVCGQRFSVKGSLKRHTKTHAGEKPFTCSVCGQRFSRKYRAKTHKCAVRKAVMKKL
ncbi:zinc finger and BTB domain-containing protein 17-like [Phyllopteryx taeniolatus]|uniref:zinc finger and BTB domain-containing protein 17-like n=1 Tax=Phyllopteryx taeniolatus TaxID=161469 RepID=UPI002AD28ECB|nr:zinc finger and BTB domain-containing protein 17-like [Phyllopteryx taeniolatus]